MHAHLARRSSGFRTRSRDNPNVAYATKRIKCGWGAWSLVQATLYAVEAAVDAFPRATHFYMVSGDCMTIKSAKYAKDFLDSDDCDYVESFDYFESDWIKTGMKEERLIYRHFFNERTQKRRFYWSTAPAKAGPDPRNPGRYSGHDRQPMVVSASPHDRMDSAIYPRAQRCDAVFSHHMDSR